MSTNVLRREVSLLGATMLGLGSILGTGVFVSVAVIADTVGSGVALAFLLAAPLAACNALSSAQLAANHPVAGGTYEYGHRLLRPWLGFSAGWMFMCAKSAAAAAAAIGCAGYVLHSISADDSRVARTVLAVSLVTLVTLLTLAGIRRTSRANTSIVATTVLALVAFVALGAWTVRSGSWDVISALSLDSPSGDARPAAMRLLEATALAFVAYTGYGRIATLGEEVRDPRRTIPRAIILTLLISALLYAGVTIAAVLAVGPGAIASSVDGADAPLARVARGMSGGRAGAFVSTLITLGAITAMLGVLLNLVLGLSRVLLAMARRGDAPRVLAGVSDRTGSPAPATIAVGVAIGALAAIGRVRLAWSFSAFTVLVYYAITNLAALRLPREARLYPPFIAWLGLGGCLGLAFIIEPRVWAAGSGVLAIGLVARSVVRGLTRSPSGRDPAP